MKYTQVLRLISIAGLLVGLETRAATEPLSSSVGYGADPILPEPQHKLIPTVKIAPAVGWKTGVTPIAAAGLKVNALAIGLDHPRWLYVLPNGDVLVAETNAPPKPDDGKGLKAWIMKKEMSRAGAGGPTATLTNWRSDSSLRVPDPFLMCALAPPPASAIRQLDRATVAPARAAESLLSWVPAWPTSTGRAQDSNPPYKPADQLPY